MSDGPSKIEIQEIFRRLRNLTSNRVCFDCNAKNPTWASITYGVFICIDCSAVHRSLGVHLSFVRSTQLDTTWTWIQLRNMQIGGNANASAFFSQHHCTSNDSQQKYNSRAAQLYREKLNQIVAKYNKIHGNKIDFEKEDGSGDTPTEKDADFFEEMNLTHTAIETLTLDNSARLTKQENGNKLNKEGPNVEGVLNESSPSISTISGVSSSSRKPTIGQRKTLGGAKKGGMGAQKVKADFSEIEKEASMLDQMRERQEEDAKIDAERRVADEEKQAATMRLAYQDLSKQQKQREQQLLKMDPKKAEQVERLGMGIGVRSGVSHSAISDMMTIDQENPSSKSSKSSRRNNDSFFDEFEIVENSIHSSIGAGFSNKRLDDWELIGSSNNGSSTKNKSIIDERDDILSAPRRPIVAPGSPGTDEAQKKFGGAKAISSDQYFGSRDNEYERRSNISRFEGQKSISSADYFGDGQQTNQPASYSALQNVDLDDVKESVRQGVTKVAGKLSTLANGMMSSIQEKYGY